MEKLQQALEKARHARSGTLGRLGFDFPLKGELAADGLSGDGVLLDPQRAVSVPHSDEHLRRNRIVVQVGNQSVWPVSRRAAEAFRMARTRVLHALEPNNGRVVSVTSARQGDGKTLVSVNLAVGLAKHPNFNVLLIDADLRRPAVKKVLGINPKYGLSDYLMGTRELDECLINPGIENMLVLPQVERLHSSSELLSSEKFGQFLKEVRQRHPNWLILLDCPPLLAVDDTLVLMRYADGCLLVVREGSTRRSELRRAAELIGEERFLGTVLNFAESHRDSGYYYYYYYYGSS